MFLFSSLELIILIIVFSFSASNFTVPLALKIGEKYKIFDSPSKRKQPNKKLLRAGGIGIIIAFTVSIILLNFLSNNSLFANTSVLIIFICSFFFFIIGLVDDIFSLSPFLRLIFQILIAYGVWLTGLRIESINISWLNIPNIELSEFLSSTLTVFWLVGITNAINWLDGLDGLAAGVSGFAGLGLTIISFQNGQLIEPIIASAISGCSFGFLKYNFFPAKLLMGDSGSYLLGFLLAAVSLLSINSENNAIGILVPIFLLILPITDMTAVIISRIKRGKSPFWADRKHIHHRLLNNGFSELGAVINIYALSQWITIFTITLASSSSAIYIIFLVFSSFLLFLIPALLKLKKY